METASRLTEWKALVGHLARDAVLQLRSRSESDDKGQPSVFGVVGKRGRWKAGEADGGLSTTYLARKLSVAFLLLNMKERLKGCEASAHRMT